MVKKRLKDTATAFAPSIAGLCHATQAAGAVVPEARELNSYLLAVGTEVDTVIDFLLRELERQAAGVRGGQAVPDLPQSAQEAPPLRKIMIACFVFQYGCVATRRRKKSIQIGAT